MDEVEDIHICGSCRREFTQLDLFVIHKKSCRSNVKATVTGPPGGDMVQASNTHDLDVAMVTEGTVTSGAGVDAPAEMVVYSTTASPTTVTALTSEPKLDDGHSQALLPLITQIQRQLIEDHPPQNTLGGVSQEQLSSKDHMSISDMGSVVPASNSGSVLQISPSPGSQLVNSLNVQLVQNQQSDNIKMVPESYQTLVNPSHQPVFTMSQLEQVADLHKVKGEQQISYQVSYHGAVPVIQLAGGVGSIQGQTQIQGQSFQVEGHDISLPQSALHQDMVQITQGSQSEGQSVQLVTLSATQQQQQQQQQQQAEQQQLALQAILASATQTTPSKGGKATPKQSPKSSKKGKYTKLTTMMKQANANIGTPGIQTLNMEVPTNKDTSNLSDSLMEHYNQKEKIPARHHCSFTGCAYVTQYAKNVDRHMLIHTGHKPHVCDVCNSRFSRSDKLREHQRIHTGDKPYKCTVCDYRCGDSSSLKKHNRIHTDERPFRCQICDYASRNSSQLTVHLRTHTGDKPFMCPECSSCFKIKSDLKRHKRLHTGERPYSCNICGVRTAVKSNLVAHMKIYHSEENMVTCELCNFKTSSKRVFKSHQKTHSDPSRVLSCNKCVFVCSDSAAMRIHTRIHTDDKQFSCPHCQYFTKTKLYLTRHVKTRHPNSGGKQGKKRVGKGRCVGTEGAGDRTTPRRLPGIAICREQFKCNLCDAGFVRKDSLRSHLRSHKEKDTYNAEKKGTVLGSEGIPFSVQPQECGASIQESSTHIHIVPSVPPTYRIQQEHEYAAVLSDPHDLQGQRSRSTEQSEPPYNQHVTVGGATSQGVAQAVPGSRQAEYKHIQNLLPYIQNNHNMAMWDNVQNMAISDHQSDDNQDQGHHGLSLQGQGHRQTSGHSHTQDTPLNHNIHSNHSNLNHGTEPQSASEGYVAVETVDYAMAQSISTSEECVVDHGSPSYSSIPGTSVTMGEHAHNCNLGYGRTSGVELSGHPETPTPQTPALTLTPQTQAALTLTPQPGGSGQVPVGNVVEIKPVETPPMALSTPSTLSTPSALTTPSTLTTPAALTTPSTLTTPAALSTLPLDVQQMIKSLNLPRGTVISVPLMEQTFQIVTDSDPTQMSVPGSMQTAAMTTSEQCYHSNQALTSVAYNNNSSGVKETAQVPPRSDPPAIPAVASEPGSVTQTDPPVLQMAQPLYLLAESIQNQSLADS